jgi:hypothetical protein
MATTLARSAGAVGTKFTYQGRLDKNEVPANSSCSFQFSLWDAATSGTLIAGPVNASVVIEDGLFTAPLDFGNVFDGNPRWLEISVNCQGDPGYTVLTPRQEITSSPYSIRSSFAENGGGGGSQWITNGASIYYTGGNVGIGVTNPNAKLRVDTGTTNNNPAVFTNENEWYAALASGNSAPNGIGFYDAISARHYIAGFLGIGAENPDAPLHVDGSRIGMIAEANGAGIGTGPKTAVWARGFGSAFNGACAGLVSESTYGNGVEGVASNAGFYGGYFDNTAGGTALYADGLAKVRTLQILGGADLVEGFDTTEEAAEEPGTVVVIDEKHAGRLRASRDPYDSKVAGIVSGAGGVEAGIRLGQEGKLDGETPVAMTGRVYVKCSAENGAIRPGDLLTTSTKSGHAMRATNRELSHGAVIGKAMGSLESGSGLVLVLVNLQ